MKKLSYIASLCLFFVAAALVGCGEDRTHEYYEMTEENQWTYSKMCEVYLWRDMIKEPQRSTFFSTTTKFFNELKYKDDKASFFTDTVSAGSYGMTFAVMRDPIGERPSKVYALVLMVEPGSPADVAGIRRGTWISSVGGMAFTLSKYSMLQSGGSTDVVTELIEYDDELQKYYWEPGDTLPMAASVNYEERAVLLDSIYKVRGKNIGYLVLNNFSGDDFVRQTQDIMLRFAASDISDAIIDLRYCNGGSIANAASLASSLVPVEKHGEPFCILADSEYETDTAYCYAPQPATLGEKKMYVILGNGTAGTAEVFTAALDKARSMYDLITVGANTAGVNVITEKFESPYGFAINPATNYVMLADTTQLTAIIPDYAVNELQQPVSISLLGSEQEHVLFNVLHLAIDGMLPGEQNGNTPAISRPSGKYFVK